MAQIAVNVTTIFVEHTVANMAKGKKDTAETRV